MKKMLAMVLAALLMVALVSTSGVGTALALEDGTIGTMGINPPSVCTACGGPIGNASIIVEVSRVSFTCTHGNFLNEKDIQVNKAEKSGKACQTCGKWVSYTLKDVAPVILCFNLK